MKKYYTDEKNAQVIIALLKEHGIRKVIASPGTTNMALVASMQQDSYFEMYSSVDERSGAYMACGLAAETGEPVVISCTGATASRNYLPGLTEAYYRKLPVLAITSTQAVSRIGHNIEQVIDRSSIPKDVAKLSVTLPIVKDDDDLWDCEIKVNQAILELKRRGGGPVHINLPTTYSRSYETKSLPKYHVINRITTSTNEFPELTNKKVAVFVGAHTPWTKELTEMLDMFCVSNNAVVFCDHTSNYKGKYRVFYSIAAAQKMFDSSAIQPDILIHIGEISGGNYNLRISGKQVWRVNEDGEIRDTFRRIRYVFEMSELSFFTHYSKNKTGNSANSLDFYKDQLNELYNRIPELPFSNIWIASKMAYRIPEGSTIHFGILNSLRSWNFFEVPHSVSSASNVGGFGIDGNISSIIGASLTNRNKLYFGVIGDLAFFYDLNVLGNHHVRNNLRILLINNGKGTEFRQFDHIAAHFEEDAEKFIAAAGHFGNKSRVLVNNFAIDLGFEYLSASDKQEFEQVYERFITPEITEKPIIFEVFTNNMDESGALEAIMNIENNIKIKTKQAVKQVVKQVLSENTLNILKRVIRK